MKLLLLIIFTVCITAISHAQSSSAINLANKISMKMKDSIGLSDHQRQEIYNINIQLYNSKMIMRQKYATSDLLRYYIQKVENTRDSLYKAVLPNAKYLLYKQMKRDLVSNN